MPFFQVSTEVHDDQHDDYYKTSLQRACDKQPFQQCPREEGKNLSLPPVRYNRSKAKKVNKHVNTKPQPNIPQKVTKKDKNT